MEKDNKMRISTNLLKMKTALNSGTVDYFLTVQEKDILLNSYIGKPMKIIFQNQINCVKCGRKTNKSFNQGFCYPCFQTAPEADPAIIRPELDQSHLGIARDMEWAKENFLVDHYVYISLTSGIKVGVTRHTNIPSRWVDQGAVKAIKLAKTPNRYLAGLIEVSLKDHFADKTNWRKMLTNTVDEKSLFEEKMRAVDFLTKEFSQYIVDDNEETEIRYPVLEYPLKVKSVGLDKLPEVGGILTGIKGQYLYFDQEFVFNVRKHGGYLVNIEL